jgi:hypothetical protein
MKLDETQKLFLEDLVKMVISIEHMWKYLDAKVGIEDGSKTCFPISKDIVWKDSSIYGYTLCRFVCPTSTWC